MNESYVQKYVRSCDCLIDDILAKLLESLNIVDIVIIDNEKNDDVEQPSNPADIVDMETIVGMVNGTQSGEQPISEENNSDLDSVLGDSSNSNPTLHFSDEVRQEILLYDELIAKKSTDIFTDGTCDLKERGLSVRYSATLDFSKNLSYDAMIMEEKRIINSIRIKDDPSQQGETLWEKFLSEKNENDKNSSKIKCEIEYHLCNMHELFVRFYNMKMEPTCIFMNIGMSLYLFKLGLKD